MSWRVSKSSGQVWTTTSGTQNVALTSDIELNAGDSIRTGPTGRVLLTRGEETILISPNSAVSIPTDQKQDGLSTTIIEQAGSILVHAEKRNVKHFQVETPYLAAVVKGTHFRVGVTSTGSRVAVFEGKVEVSDFKTGQIALVLPGQAANVPAAGNHGLTLRGSGKFNPIERGAARTPSFDRIPVPKKGLAMPTDASIGMTVRALAHIDVIKNSFASADSAHGVRIMAPLGEMKLDLAKATNGLAHDAGLSRGDGSGAGRLSDSDGGASNGDGGGNSGSNAGGLSGGGVGGVGGIGNGGGNGNGLALGNVANGLTGNTIGIGNEEGRALGIVLGKGKAIGKQ